MCRGQIAVRFDGKFYDYDFNEMIPLKANKYETIDEILKLKEEDLEREITYAEHCYACTAGAGSSCGGALE